MSNTILKILTLLFLLGGIYAVIIEPLLAPLIDLPDFPYGMFGGSYSFILFALAHAIYTFGSRHAFIFLWLCLALSWTFEQIGVATGNIYGDYNYTDALGVKFGSVPVFIPLSWFMMLYSSYILTNCILEDHPIGSYGNLARIVMVSIVSAVVMTAQDLVIDPIASDPLVENWIWKGGGEYFGVPFINYFGWIITSCLIYLIYRLFEWRVPPRPLGPLTKAFVTMPFIAYGSMIATGNLGVGPSELKIIGPFVLGMPILIAISKVWFRNNKQVKN